MKISFRFVMAAIVAAMTCAAAPGVANADGHAAKFRSAMMKGIGASMGGLSMVAKGKAPASNAAALADAMNSFASITGNIFPEGSGGAKTRAKDEIWSNPAEFKAAVTAFQKAAANMASAAARGGDMKAAFGMLGKSCSGCHRSFRKPKS